MITTVLALGAAAGPSEGSEFRIEPAVTVGEEYNDNIFLDATNEAEDFITRVIPSVHALYRAPLWDWDVTYAYEYRYYLHGTYDNYDTQRLSLSNLTRVVEEFFFIKVLDTYSPVSLSVARDFTQESLNVNQSDQNIFTFNPFLVFRPTKRTTLNTGYQYRDVWYKDYRATDKQEQSGYADLQHELSPRVMMTGNASFLYSSASNTRYTQELRYTQGTVKAGPKYEYQDRSMVWGTVGLSRFEHKTDSAVRFVWDAGVIHQEPVTVFSVQTGRNWIDDPIYITRREDRYVASVKRTVEPATLGLTAGFYVYATGSVVQTRRNSLSFSAGYGLTPRLNGYISLSFNSYKTYESTPFPAGSTSTTSDQYLTDLRLTYLATEKLSFSCGYQYTDSTSPDGSTGGYTNNRVTAEAKMTF